MSVSFSSLYIGILAATLEQSFGSLLLIFVSVPFTSGSSLQLYGYVLLAVVADGFSSLYIGILAATFILR